MPWWWWEIYIDGAQLAKRAHGFAAVCCLVIVNLRTVAFPLRRLWTFSEREQLAQNLLVRLARLILANDEGHIERLLIAFSLCVWAVSQTGT